MQSFGPVSTFLLSGCSVRIQIVGIKEIVAKATGRLFRVAQCVLSTGDGTVVGEIMLDDRDQVGVGFYEVDVKPSVRDGKVGFRVGGWKAVTKPLQAAS